jgi:hypothetical protein
MEFKLKATITNLVITALTTRSSVVTLILFSITLTVTAILLNIKRGVSLLPLINY